MRRALEVVFLVLIATTASAQSADVVVSRLMKTRALRDACTTLERDRDLSLPPTEVQKDAAGNLLALRSGSADGVVVASLDPENESIVTRLLHALSQAGIRTRYDVLFVVGPAAGIDEVVNSNLYRDRVRYFIGLDATDAEKIGIVPTLIGSTIVRLAAEVFTAYGMNPAYTAAGARASLPISLKIPSITIGAGNPPDPKRECVLLSVIVGLAEVEP